MEIVNSKITLRPFTLDDVDEHLNGQDDEQTRWMGGKSTKESVTNWVLRSQEDWKNNGPVYTFAVVNKTGDLIGMIDANTDYKELDGVSEGEANISYSIYPKFRGKGYAGEAISLIEKFLSERNINKSVIRVSPQNTASLRVPEKLGYSNKGQIATRDGDELIVFTKSLCA